MPKKCFVSGCKTGYQSNKEVEAEMAAKGTPISIFMFPKDDTLRNKWLHKISKDDDEKIVAKMYVCSLHFKEEDYKTERVCRGTERPVRSLKKDSVPTIFNNASYPSYKKDTSAKKRTTSMSRSVARKESALAKHEQEIEPWLESDKFTTLIDLNEKLIRDR